MAAVGGRPRGSAGRLAHDRTVGRCARGRRVRRVNGSAGRSANGGEGGQDGRGNGRNRRREALYALARTHGVERIRRCMRNCISDADAGRRVRLSKRSASHRTLGQPASTAAPMSKSLRRTRTDMTPSRGRVPNQRRHRPMGKGSRISAMARFLVRRQATPTQTARTWAQRTADGWRTTELTPPQRTSFPEERLHRQQRIRLFGILGGSDIQTARAPDAGSYAHGIQPVLAPRRRDLHVDQLRDAD